MRITSAAMSFISLPSPKANAFREGPKKEKRKSRSLSKVFSPIRKMGKQISKLSNRNSPKKDRKERSSKSLQVRDEEQGWIATANTFETEDTLSPRSFDSLTTSDSTPLLQQTEEKEEIMCFSVNDTSQQTNDDGFLDLEAGFNESASTSSIFRRDIDVENNITEKYESPNAAPHVETEVEGDFASLEIAEDFGSDGGKEFRSNFPTIQDHEVLEETSIGNNHEEIEDSMVSLLSRIDTTQVIDEGDEIDSLSPAADISFFLSEEDGNDFHCVGRLSTPKKELPPVEIDVDSADDLSISSSPENKCQELYIEDEDEISVTSYNSYLQAIESITASANSEVEQAITAAMDESEIETPSYPPIRIEDTEEPPELDLELDEEDYRVSFNPSRELLLQAMEGASEKAKADIERATALALSKMRSAKADSSKRHSSNASNRILGFLFFLLLLFQCFGNSFQIFWGVKSISHSIGIDQFQMQVYSERSKESHSEHRIWGEAQVARRENETNVAMSNEHYFYNIGCANKLGCLALGNL